MSALEQMYQQLILDHSRDPHGKGLGDEFDAESFQVNPTCGDQVQLRVRLGEQGGQQKVESVSWDGRGCFISQASVSIMNDLVVGSPLERVEELRELFVKLMHSQGNGLGDEQKEEQLEDAIVFQGVSQYPARVKCALLGWMALRDALTKAQAGDNTPVEILKDM